MDVLRTRCTLCPHKCVLDLGQTGFCRARKNIGGSVKCINYGLAASIMLDPIEKKPLRMYYPGSMVLSYGSFGCNMRCPFCQNHEISQVGEDGVQTAAVTPKWLAKKALELEGLGNIGVAFTYNEPLVGPEFVCDTARLVKENGQKNILVTNGMFNSDIFDDVFALVDAINVDLKCFDRQSYTKLGGSLETVMDFISAATAKCHVEVTSLIVPGLNDRTEMMDRQCLWLASVNQEIPLHITYFYPRYNMTAAAQVPHSAMRELCEAAKGHLSHVFSPFA